MKHGQAECGDGAHLRRGWGTESRTEKRMSLFLWVGAKEKRKDDATGSSGGKMEG